jgi:hypothetical protein
MMARVAALIVIAAMVMLLWHTFEMTGRSAILFYFVGHPMLAIGLLLGFIALSRRLRRERAEGGGA